MLEDGPTNEKERLYLGCYLEHLRFQEARLGEKSLESAYDSLESREKAALSVGIRQGELDVLGRIAFQEAQTGILGRTKSKVEEVLEGAKAQC